MIEWVKKKLGITELKEENKRLSDQVKNHKEFVRKKVSDLQEYTRVDADVGIRGNNTIVLTGVYRNQGYVRFYDIGDGEFEHLVRQMKHMKDHCLIRHIDQPPGYRGLFDL
ncbi:MAG: hypothetical protein JKX92_06210 [Porticoccaceae bacterium]|nr:hypothetical protein [Porticoccaceae bacterium]